jgi:hypothetical protein
MENLNIIHLIEKNSITRLTKDYENKFLMKIKEHFNDNQQQLFVASFYCFLNYDKKNDFIIDFDNVWKWLGFTRKDSAKKLLEKFFTKEIDFKIVFRQSVENLFGGRPKENIMLNISTFKKFCLKADTKKADEVHDYYIKLEELLQETIDEETNELRLQLTYKEEEKIRIEEEKIRIENEKILLEDEHKKSIDEIEKLNKQLHKRYEPRIITEEKFVVYLLVAHINGRTIYIIGKTADITKRYRSYRLKGILIHEEDIKLEYYKSCRSSIILNQVEGCVILNMSKYIVEGTREVFESTEFNETDMIEKFKEVIDFYVNSFNHVSPHITIQNRDLKEEARLRTELYVEENRDEINEKVREDRLENPEKFKEREKKRDPEKKKAKNKRYNETHKEQISQYHAEYRSKPENKEKINQRRKNRIEKMTPEQLEEKALKAKEYREQNKVKRKENASQKIRCLVCKSVFSKQCWKRHTKSSFHIKELESNPNINEDFEILLNIL